MCVEEDTAVQRLYSSLRSAFDACDEDVNLSLDEAETASMLKKCFGAATAGTSAATLAEKVRQLMSHYDAGGKGSLEWDELLMMLCGGSDMGLPLEASTCAGLLSLAWVEYSALQKSQSVTFGEYHELPVRTERKATALRIRREELVAETKDGDVSREAITQQRVIP